MTTDVALCVGYGMTEATSVATFQPLTKPIVPGSSGVPLPNMEIQVCQRTLLTKNAA